MNRRSTYNELNDSVIRFALIEYFNSESIPKNKIFQELHVVNGRAKADIVTLYDEPQCFEIKSDLDRLERVQEQSKYYEQAFRYNNLVTTKKYVDRAKDILPSTWGLYLATNEDKNNVTIKRLRKAKLNRNFDKEVALLTLWKSELIFLLNESDAKAERKSRKVLASDLAMQYKAKTLSELLAEILSLRIEAKLQLCT